MAPGPHRLYAADDAGISLHNQGMFHCGIAPENILLNKRGQMVLTGFSLPEVRTMGSGLTAELYGGYSAPEQYSKKPVAGRVDRCLLPGGSALPGADGKEPLPALQRERRDPMKDAVEENPAIPEYVSDAIAKAMRFSKKDRYQSVDEFTAALLEESSSNTAVFRPEASEQEHPKLQEPSKSGSGKGKGNVWLIGVAISAVVNLVLLGLLFSTPGDWRWSRRSPLRAGGGTGTVEQQLVGVYYPFVQQNLNLVRAPRL